MADGTKALNILPKSTIKRVVVNRHIIDSNRKHGKKDPAISIQTSKGTFRAHWVDILGPSEVIYRPEKPLSCGASVWIETKSSVHYVVHTRRGQGILT